MSAPVNVPLPLQSIAPWLTPSSFQVQLLPLVELLQLKLLLIVPDDGEIDKLHEVTSVTEIVSEQEVDPLGPLPTTRVQVWLPIPVSAPVNVPLPLQLIVPWLTPSSFQVQLLSYCRLLPSTG